jgi:outer membrane protein
VGGAALSAACSALWVCLCVDAQAIGLSALLREAQSSDPTVLAAESSRDITREGEPQARANLLPSLSANLQEGATRYDLRVPGTPVLAKTFNAWGPAITLNATLYSAALWDTLDQAQLATQQAQIQLEQTRSELALRVTQTYFDELAAADALAAVVQTRSAILEQREQARREFELGTKTAVDLHESEARLDQADAQAEAARAVLQARHLSTESLLGHAVGALDPLREDASLDAPEPHAIDAWVLQTEQNNPRILAARLGVEIARRQVKIAHDGALPVISVSGSMQYQKSDNYSIYLPVNTTTTQSTLGIQVTVPVFSGGAIQSHVREASARQSKAEQDLELARRTALQTTRQAFLDVQSGLAQVKSLEAALVSATTQRESTKLGYRVGVRINLDVLNADTQLQNTQRDLKKARYDVLINGLKLKQSAGTSIDADVMALDRLLKAGSAPGS